MAFEPEEIEVYRDFRITTRIGNGVRVYLPKSNGIFDFADSIEEARANIDKYYEEETS